MESLPQAIDKAYKELYGNHPLFAENDWWYQRFIGYYIDAGIPEKGIVGILKKHRIPQTMVKQYGATSGLVPENVARQVLRVRHESKNYDSLAKPKIRVTKKRIADFRRDLEAELRRIYKPVNLLEKTVKYWCYDMSDEEITSWIKSRMTPQGQAWTIDWFD